MELYKSLMKKQDALSVVGLGYVGMPLAIAFAKKIRVVGFDINESIIESYLSGHDLTHEVGNDYSKCTSAYRC